MSTIAGICTLDTQAVDPAWIERMNQASCLLAPFAVQAWVAGPIGFGCCSFRQIGGAATLGQSGADSRLGLKAVADARIDNRKELVQALAHLGASEADSDVALILKAYACWGIPSLRRLVGDFALAIWDEANRRLVCARDPLGVKSLYWSADPHRMTFASQIPQVLAAAGRQVDVDVEYVADHLALGVLRSNTSRTPYKGIVRLLPGQCVIVERDAARVVRYWDWEVEPRIEHEREDDYATHFLSLFSDAVMARLRTEGAVWADLSGGLDSSSIVCLASELLAQKGDGRTLSTVSVVFDDAANSDERRWAAPVRDKYGLRENLISGDRYHPLMSLLDGVRYWDEPHAASVFSRIHACYRDLLGSSGATVLLSGAGAEAVVMGKNEGPVHLADLLSHLRLPTLRRDLDSWQRRMRVPLSNLIASYCIRPLMRPRLISYGWQRQVHSWIEPDFARRWDLRERAQHAAMPARFANPADQLHYEKLGRVTGFLLRGYLEKCCDIRYPYLHRPLVEFMLATPWHVKLNAAESKTLLRRAMTNILPVEVRTRTMATSFGHAVYLGIQKEWKTIETLVAASRLSELGCVSQTELTRAARLARCGHAQDLHGLISTLSLEAWLQVAFGRVPAGVKASASDVADNSVAA